MSLHNQNPPAAQAQSIYALGIMSGTSMDGIDLGLVRATMLNRTLEPTLGRALENNKGYSLEALEAPFFVPFDTTTRQLVQAVLGVEQHNEATRMAEQALNQAYIAAVKQWQAHYPEHTPDIIGLHGQTITHRPQQQFTWQLGDGHALAQAVGIPVVYNFRQQDIRAGGEGAPLAPVFHQALSQSSFLPAPPFAVLNIGGVSNITLIGETDLVAFDCGPGNAAMDDFCQQRTGAPFDKDGSLAAQGRVDSALLDTMMQHPYFAREAPKSLDRQDFGHAQAHVLSNQDGLRTLAAFTAEAIAHGVRQHLPRFRLSQIAVAGGGRHNMTVMQELRHRLAPISIEPIEHFHSLLAGDTIEAWAFAWLALLKYANLPASFPDTTGVGQPTIAGIFAYC